MSVVQNKEPEIQNIEPVINDEIVKTVKGIIEAVIKLNPVSDIFGDLVNKLVVDLKANSFMDINLELKVDQREQLLKVIQTRGTEAVQEYLAKVNTDSRTKEIYEICKKKTASIADAILSGIGQEINRGAIINAEAVQANSKNKAYDEILLRKSKSAGDITVPTSGIFIASNCVEVIKASCRKKEDRAKTGTEEKEKKSEKKSLRAAADKPAKPDKIKDK